MKKYLFQVLLYLLIGIGVSYAQSDSATVEVRPFFDIDRDLLITSIDFEINGVKFNGNDSSIQKIPINEAFDSCTVITNRDTIEFVTKFRSEDLYRIDPGCCCTHFTMIARTESRKGVAIFTNETKRTLAFSVCEHISDSILVNQEKTLFASESAMCLFKPCKISVCETSFLNERYDSQLYHRSFLATQYYHFLHGEKIEVEFDESNKTLTFMLMGYLTEQEFKQVNK